MIALYAQGEKRVQVVEESRRWEEAGLISPAQATAVRERYRPELVRVNLFIRILLAFFTAIGVVALIALPAVLLRVEQTGMTLLFLLFVPLCAWVADHQLIQGRRLYRCGAEEILLFMAVVFLALAIGIPSHDWGRSVERLSWLAAHGVFLIGATLLAIRYGYALAALGAVVALAALPFHLAEALHWYRPGWSRVVLFLLLSTLGIWAQQQLGRRGTLPRGTIWCLETVRLTVLAGIYLDVNLLAHRLLWLDWLGWMPGARGGYWSAPWVDPLCAALTALLPVAALGLGIVHRDRALLWYGVFTGTASILTLKYFYHLGYLAEQLTIAGLVLGGLAFGLLRWLRRGAERRRGAFTAEPLLEPRLYGLDAEALAAMQPLAPTPKEAPSGGFQGGDGEFRGGGASASY
ncbi:MAG: hypothetical protein CVU69_01820 [Deltaproteobacteria bacterium HGW-Deltaproteobacteria-4]|nr:MAG: hypothetical protein CVU69_01820 [Deltaproteobacteria bacterium HGW-Deltaproteobacteria-4]